jgi:preprotein translocase SecE subunit
MSEAKQKGFLRYFSEVREEMRKVTWPTPVHVRNITLLVIAISVAIAALFGGLDFVFTYALNFLLSA